MSTNNAYIHALLIRHKNIPRKVHKNQSKIIVFIIIVLIFKTVFKGGIWQVSYICNT